MLLSMLKKKKKSCVIVFIVNYNSTQTRGKTNKLKKCRMEGGKSGREICGVAKVEGKKKTKESIVQVWVKVRRGERRLSFQTFNSDDCWA